MENQSLSFSDMLTLIFITLKLLDKFPYSWWIVWSPLLVMFILDAIAKFAEINAKNKLLEEEK